MYQKQILFYYNFKYIYIKEEFIMLEILNYLPLLGIAVVCNILCGIYYNINVKEIKFNWLKLLNGIIKAIIVIVVFIGMAYIFDQMKELAEALGVKNKYIMVSEITLYTSKVLISLGKILGVEIKIETKKEQNKIDIEDNIVGQEKEK